MAVLTKPLECAKQQLTVESHDWKAWPQIAKAWSTITDACEHPTFFLLPEAVETWVATFGARLHPLFLLFRTRDRDSVGACIIVRRTERRGPFLVRRVYLNTAGEDEGDSPCIEYNELLCMPGYEASMARALRAHLDDQSAQHPWDELQAPGMLDGPSLRALQATFGEAREIDDVKASYYVDLAELRKRGKDYVDKLPSRERTRLRQNIRKYSEIGELQLDEARTTLEALEYLDALADLHQRTWTSRGERGAFASPTFYDYHRRLIGRCFSLGRVQLLRLRAGDETIGYHYNFVFGGESYFYQCGYDYALGAKLSPGATLHRFAIHRAAEQGLQKYEFMAGDVEYKRRLATGSRKMHWIAWQAPTTKMKAFELVRRTKRALVGRIDELRAAMVASLRGLVMKLRGQE
ncbi:MAG: GNAT family N-acetyltransferase [Kofleriaceae bacterium]|nr:GNAT family N-acetyltransferase [Kofleriaceae bacterium]